MNLRKFWLPLAFVVALWVGGEAQIGPVRDTTSGVIIKDTTFLPAAERQIGLGDSGTPIDVGAYAEGVIYIDIKFTDVAGIDLPIDFESCSSPASDDCFIHSSWNIPSQGLFLGKGLLRVNNFGRYVRIKYYLGKTATFSVKGTFKGYR